MIINLQDCPAIWIGGLNLERAQKIKNMYKTLCLKEISLQAVRSENFNGNTKSTLKALELALTYKQPVIIFEDDANYTEYYNNIVEIPNDTDAVWLGTSMYGLVKGWEHMSIRDGIYLTTPTKVDEYKNFYKVENMLSAHAVLYISERYITNMINYFKYCINQYIAPDIIFAATMKDYNIYACKQPMFYQDDNAHNYKPTITSLVEIFEK
jgi:hypothetical protein